MKKCLLLESNIGRWMSGAQCISCNNNVSKKGRLSHSYTVNVCCERVKLHTHTHTQNFSFMIFGHMHTTAYRSTKLNNTHLKWILTHFPHRHIRTNAHTKMMTTDTVR